MLCLIANHHCFAQTNERQSHGFSDLFYVNGKWGWQSGRNQQGLPAVYDSIVKVDDRHLLVRRFIKSKQQSLWGLINSNGKWWVKPTYISVEIVGDRIIVGEQRQNLISYGLISFEGQILIPGHYEHIQSISGGAFAGSRGKMTYLFDSDGRKKLGLEADSISTEADVVLFYKNGLAGVVLSPVQSIEPQFDSVAVQNGSILGINYNQWTVVTASDSLRFRHRELIPWHNRYIAGNGEYYWLINKNDQPLTKGFTSIQPLNSRFAIAIRGKTMGVFTQTGEGLLPVSFDTVFYVNDFFYAHQINKSNGWAVYDTFGIRKNVLDYDLISPMSEGMIPIHRNKKWGFLDRYGSEIIEPVYDKVDPFSRGMSKVTYYGEEGVIDKSGNWIVHPSNQVILGYDPQRYLSKGYGLYSLISLNGRLIYFSRNTLIWKDDHLEEQDSLGRMKRIIGMNGTINVQERSSYPNTYYSEDRSLRLHPFYKNGKYGFLNRDNTLVISNRYDSVKLFSEHRAAVKINSHWGYIDELERLVIQPTYDYVGKFYGGKALVQREGLWGVITTAGKEIIPLDYDAIQPTSSGKYIVSKKNRQGVLDTNGANILAPLYDLVEEIDENRIIVERKTKYGISNRQGVLIVPLIYQKIMYDKPAQQLLFYQKISTYTPLR